MVEQDFDYIGIMETEADTIRKRLKKSKEPSNVLEVVKASLTRMGAFFDTVCKDYDIVLPCKEACPYCCYVRVEVSPPEVFYISNYIHRHFSEKEMSSLLKRIRNSAARARGLTSKQYARARIPCPLLADNKCSIYPARPGTCRILHSRDVDVCKKAYEDAENAEYDPIQNEGLRMGSVAFLVGLKMAFERAKLDSGSYELSQALAVTLTNPKAYTAWLKGKKMFTALPAEEYGEWRRAGWPS